MPIYTPGKLTLRQTYIGTDDPDAAAYIAAVEAADGQALETATRVAIHSFVKGCKADGIWPAIKASCILAGARTLAGALVPLVGAAPTNVGNGFVSGDYDRKTGLVGNGSTKYLNSNRANNADPQNNNHNACWVSSPAVGTLMASSSSNTGQNYMDTNTLTNTRFLSRNNSNTAEVPGAIIGGLYGHNRISASQFSYRCPQGNGTYIAPSQTPEINNVLIYARGGGAVSSARLAFYSIGESLNLALLDARVTALINAFAAAIP